MIDPRFGQDWVLAGVGLGVVGLVLRVDRWTGGVGCHCFQWIAVAGVKVTGEPKMWMATMTVWCRV